MNWRRALRLDAPPPFQVIVGRLRNIAPMVANLGSRLARQTDAEGHSRVTEHWRAWYGLKRWKDLRLAVFLRDLFTCQMKGCGRVEGDTSKLVADHKKPHRGDPALFWNPDNVHTLCKPCHDGAKQREERAAPW